MFLWYIDYKHTNVCCRKRCHTIYTVCLQYVSSHCVHQMHQYVTVHFDLAGTFFFLSAWEKPVINQTDWSILKMENCRLFSVRVGLLVGLGQGIEYIVCTVKNVIKSIVIPYSCVSVCACKYKLCAFLSVTKNLVFVTFHYFLPHNKVKHLIFLFNVPCYLSKLPSLLRFVFIFVLCAQTSSWLVFVKVIFISSTSLSLSNAFSLFCFACYREECELVGLVHGEDGVFVVVEWSAL